MTDEVSDDTRRFVMRHIHSVAQLEALLLLRANAKEEWTVSRVAQRLYVPDVDAAALLDHLADSRLVERGDGGFRYACATPDLAGSVDRLADAYSRHLIPITNLIHSKPRRIRQFADAFKFRKES